MKIEVIITEKRSFPENYFPTRFLTKSQIQ